MKVYFAGSIRGGRQDAELYRRVIAALKEKRGVCSAEYLRQRGGLGAERAVARVAGQALRHVNDLPAVFAYRVPAGAGRVDREGRGGA